MRLSKLAISLLLFQSVPFGAVVGVLKVQNGISELYQDYNENKSRFILKFPFFSFLGLGCVVGGMMGGAVCGLPGGMYFGGIRFWNYYKTGDKGWINPLQQPLSWCLSPTQYLFYPNGSNSWVPIMNK